MNIDSISLNGTMEIKGVDEVCKVAIENRDKTESLRRLAPEVAEQLKIHKLCRLGLPKFLGGWEDNPVEVLKVFESLSSAEGSVAWIVWNNHLACTFGRFLDEQSLSEIYGDSSHIYANSAIPGGVAKEVSDGYIVNGRWKLVSGCQLADWFVLRCRIEGNELEGKSILKFLFIPKKDVEIIDTWYVGGLKGTGSHDVVISDAIVPKNYIMDFNSPVVVDTAYNRLPIGCMNSAGNAAMALGLAKCAINELIKTGKERITPGNNPDLRDRPRVQAAVASGLPILSAATEQLHSSVSRIWQESLNSNSYSDEMLANVWSSSCRAAMIAKETLTEVFEAAGTMSLYMDSPIERAHRDIFAVLQHGIIQPHWINQAGMAYLGQTPSAPMFRI